MSKNIYLPYFVDLKYEYRTYRNIGRKYFDMKELTMEEECDVSIRKRKYATYNTYMQWEQHIIKIIPRKEKNRANFIHWLKQKLHGSESLLEAVKVILIPVYMVLLSVYINFYEQYKETMFFLLLIAITVISTCVLSKVMNKKKFYEDFIEIAEKYQVNDRSKYETS